MMLTGIQIAQSQTRVLELYRDKKISSVRCEAELKRLQALCCHDELENVENEVVCVACSTYFPTPGSY